MSGKLRLCGDSLHKVVVDTERCHPRSLFTEAGNNSVVARMRELQVEHDGHHRSLVGSGGEFRWATGHEGRSQFADRSPISIFHSNRQLVGGIRFAPRDQDTDGDTEGANRSQAAWHHTAVVVGPPAAVQVQQSVLDFSVVSQDEKLDFSHGQLLSCDGV